MSKKGAISLIVIGVALSTLQGCAPAPKLTREQALASATHRIEGSTPEQIFGAIETVFNLADPKNSRISYPDEGSAYIVRSASPFPVHIFYHWSFTLKPVDGAFELHANIKTAGVAVFIPAHLAPHESPDVMRLFFERLDHLLVGEPAWRSCKDFKKQEGRVTTLEALCLLADDGTPGA